MFLRNFVGNDTVSWFVFAFFRKFKVLKIHVPYNDVLHTKHFTVVCTLHTDIHVHRTLLLTRKLFHGNWIYILKQKNKIKNV